MPRLSLEKRRAVLNIVYARRSARFDWYPSKEGWDTLVPAVLAAGSEVERFAAAAEAAIAKREDAYRRKDAAE